MKTEDTSGNPVEHPQGNFWHYIILRKDSQICNTCRFELTNLKGRSFLDCENTARIPNQVQRDIDTVVDDDDVDNNECDQCL